MKKIENNIVTTREGRIVKIKNHGQTSVEVPLFEISHWDYSKILKKYIPIHVRETFNLKREVYFCDGDYVVEYFWESENETK